MSQPLKSRPKRLPAKHDRRTRGLGSPSAPRAHPKGLWRPGSVRQDRPANPAIQGEDPPLASVPVLCACLQPRCSTVCARASIAASRRNGGAALLSNRAPPGRPLCFRVCSAKGAWGDLNVGALNRAAAPHSVKRYFFGIREQNRNKKNALGSGAAEASASPPPAT